MARKIEKPQKQQRFVSGNPVTIPAALLHLLHVEGEAYAKNLVEKIQARTGNKVTASWGSVSPALRHLESQGLIECAGETPKSRLGKRIYKITVLGRRRAKENLVLVSELFAA